RGAAVGVWGSGRAAGGVLLRTRGDRPGVAAAGPGVPAGVRRRRGGLPPRAAERPACRVLPAGRAQPGPARAAEPALAAGLRLPAGLVRGDRAAGALCTGGARLAARVRGRLADGAGGAAAALGAHRLAD